MIFKVHCELDYDVGIPLTFLLSVRAQENAGQQILSERFDLSLSVPHEIQECRLTRTRFDKIHAEVPGLYTIRYEAEVRVKPERFARHEIQATGPESFNMEVLPYLYPSRYCQSDRLGRLTLDLFGHLTAPEEKARAVVDWIYQRISYVSGSTHAGTSAVDSMIERAGVCRDFAHLGIALCRAMNIPARYFTGYAHGLIPPDFHACFETWIGGRWLFWDATGLASPDGVVRIGTGRDAADVAVCTAFGSLNLQRFTVTCEAQDADYRQMTPEEKEAVAISLDGGAAAQ